MSRSTIDQLTREIRAKSSGTSLRSHLAVAGQVAAAVIRGAGAPPGSNVLATAAALHDIGKVTPQFQACLNGPPWHCHEDDSAMGVREFLADQPSRRWLHEVLGQDLVIPESPEELDDVIAFAVTHHGRRQYRPTPTGGVVVRPTVLKRDADAGNTLTEFDLLFRYRPVGGTVILADQIASALQDGREGLLVSVDPTERSLAPVEGDLADETGSDVELPDPQLTPFGNGLERLLLDGLRINRVEAHIVDKGWELVIDGNSSAIIRSEV